MRLAFLIFLLVTNSCQTTDHSSKVLTESGDSEKFASESLTAASIEIKAARDNSPQADEEEQNEFQTILNNINTLDSLHRIIIEHAGRDRLKAVEYKNRLWLVWFDHSETPVWRNEEVEAFLLKGRDGEGGNPDYPQYFSLQSLGSHSIVKIFEAAFPDVEPIVELDQLWKCSACEARWYQKRFDEAIEPNS